MSLTHRTMIRTDFVFISYSRQDKAFVDRLADDLRCGGVRVWRDVEEIAPGTNWEREIKNR